MNTGKIIRKILFVSIWLAIGSGMLMLLIAAIGKQKKELCKDYTITIKGTQKNLFVDDKAIVKILEVAGNGKISGQKRSMFNLSDIEKQLENNVWIKDAELYFDNHDVLHVAVTEREPIARVFTTSGKSFYLDDSGTMMPLSDKFSAKVPVFTGFPPKVISERDSALADEVRSTASFILHDPFWMAQVAQIDITRDRDFEMVPVVGNHLVLLGDGENIKQKFHRLFVFYKEVLSRAGFDKYRTINVQYAGQVIGVKSNNVKRDTAQLRLNVEKLLKQAREMQNDSLLTIKELKEQKTIQVDPTIAATEKVADGDTNNEEKEESFTNPVLVRNPVPMKPFSNGKEGQKKDNSKVNPQSRNDGKQPKAVMPKKVAGH